MLQLKKELFPCFNQNFGIGGKIFFSEKKNQEKNQFQWFTHENFGLWSKLCLLEQFFAHFRNFQSILETNNWHICRHKLVGILKEIIFLNSWVTTWAKFVQYYTALYGPETEIGGRWIYPPPLWLLRHSIACINSIYTILEC